MSPIWNISRAIRQTEGDAFLTFIYDEWVEKVDDADAQGYHAFQHYVQIRYPAVYKKALAYARVVGWV